MDGEPVLVGDRVFVGRVPAHTGWCVNLYLSIGFHAAVIAKQFSSNEGGKLANSR